jgi:AraC-like DNA-binding protein
MATGIELDQADRLAARVRAAIIENLANDKLSLEYVARVLHHSERTLRRQLSAQGTSYQNILDEVRLEHATQYLRAGLTAEQVSMRVGYQDSRALYRAFKRWTGRPLAEARQVPGSLEQAQP